MQRNTPQREAVRAALAEARGFVSAQRLHEMLRGEGSKIGLATVYRSLAALAQAGEADSLQSPDGENLFRSCETRGHHHHLICRSCGETRELEAAVVEEWA
ncbi:MAG: Fur family transcriptional regulator, partial [Leucobacter sp.]